MKEVDFVVVGSSGGGGTISWLLAKAGFEVVVLEQGSDWFKPVRDDVRPEPAAPALRRFNPDPHDEYRYRVEQPMYKRRPRGDYNTIRETGAQQAVPFDGGWTATMLGGASMIWGGWALRALPIDFRLKTHFEATGQLRRLDTWGYDVQDWPVEYAEMAPFFNVAETLLAISGDRQSITDDIVSSPWYERFSGATYWARSSDEWMPALSFPGPPVPLTPTADFVSKRFEYLGWKSSPLPCALVSPGGPPYKTREALASAIQAWGTEPTPAIWQGGAESLWSDRVREACNMCGYCGEYLCWGATGPKSSARVTTLSELENLRNARIVTDAKVFEILYDARTRRATGVRYLDVRDPDAPVVREQKAKFVIVSCGAVQSARLLLMSGPNAGLGNRYDQVGRNAMFHLFGLGASCVFPERMQGALHAELINTGTVVTYENYFMEDDEHEWWKGGIVINAVLKNPLEGALRATRSAASGLDLLHQMEDYNRGLELRMTGDDLPMPANRVDLDPTYVDEHGLPVARLTRSFGPNEAKVSALAQARMLEVLRHPELIAASSNPSLTFATDHQIGTCRMGDDPTRSVTDRFCRLHDVPNVFVVDTSFMPTGLGVNPMVSTMANALRVGTWIVEQSRRGDDLSRPLSR